MYQELQIFEESFDSHPIWGTEGNDQSLPTLTVGDLFAHETLPALRLRRQPERGQVFAVTGVKHAFRETGQGPEADHLVMVTIALQDATSKLQRAYDGLEESLESEKQRADFFKSLAHDQAKAAAQKIVATVFDAMVSELKTQPAHGIDGDAANQWQEAASILQADGHGLAEVLRSQLRGSVSSALAQLSRIERIALWLANEDMNDWCFDDSEWPKANEDFDPLKRWHEALQKTEDELVSDLESALMYGLIGG